MKFGLAREVTGKPFENTRPRRAGWRRMGAQGRRGMKLCPGGGKGPETASLLHCTGNAGEGVIDASLRQPLGVRPAQCRKLLFHLIAIVFPRRQILAMKAPALSDGGFTGSLGSASGRGVSLGFTSSTKIIPPRLRRAGKGNREKEKGALTAHIPPRMRWGEGEQGKEERVRELCGSPAHMRRQGKGNRGKKKALAKCEYFRRGIAPAPEKAFDSANVPVFSPMWRKKRTP